MSAFILLVVYVGGWWHQCLCQFGGFFPSAVVSVLSLWTLTVCVLVDFMMTHTDQQISAPLLEYYFCFLVTDTEYRTLSKLEMVYLGCWLQPMVCRVPSRQAGQDGRMKKGYVRWRRSREEEEPRTETHWCVSARALPAGTWPHVPTARQGPFLMAQSPPQSPAHEPWRPWADAFCSNPNFGWPSLDSSELDCLHLSASLCYPDPVAGHFFTYFLLRSIHV